MFESLIATSATKAHRKIVDKPSADGQAFRDFFYFTPNMSLNVLKTALSSPAVNLYKNIGKYAPTFITLHLVYYQS